MRAGSNALVLLSLIAFTLPGCGPRRIMPPAAPESTYVGPEPTLDAAALGHFGQDTRGLVVVTDATPYAQAVVESGWLESLDPDQADRAEPDWAWVPRHVLVGWTERGERAIDRLVRVYMLGALAAAAGDPTSAVDDAERARVLQEMTAAVEALDADGLTIAVEFKSIPQAQQLMFAFGAFLSGFAPTLQGGLEVQHSEDEIIVTLRTPAQWPGEALYEGLAEVHIGRVGDPDLPALVAAFEGWRLEARVIRDGPWMVVRVGPRSTAPPLAVKDVALPRPSVPTGMPPVISGAFDMRGWKEITRGWLALWARWQNTATGRHLARIDAAGDGQLTDLDTIGRRVEELGRTNAFRFDIDGGDVHLGTVDRAMPEIPSPLIADGILRWLPTDADAIGVDGERDFGRVLADMVWSIEDRLARRELQEDIRGADGNPFEAISEAYYRNFGPLRTLLLSESDLPYARPYAWVMATPDDAIPQIAVVSRLAKDSLPRAFLDRLLRLTLGPVVAGCMPATALQLEAADLGLGTETFVVPLEGWLECADPDLRATLGPTMGAVRPHVFQKDGVLVQSTSVELSRRLLAQHDLGVRIPDGVTGKTTQYWRMTRGAVVTPTTAFARWAELPLTQRHSLDGIVGWFAGADFTTRFEGSDRVLRGVIRWANPAPMKAAPKPSKIHQ